MKICYLIAIGAQMLAGPINYGQDDRSEEMAQNGSVCFVLKISMQKVLVTV